MRGLRRWMRPTEESNPMVPPSVVASLLRDTLANYGFSLWRARGRSMRGAIAHGEVVRLVPPSAEHMTEGAVVLALLPHDQLVLHRIVGIADDQLVLRGDAIRNCDPLIAREDVIAIATPNPSPSRLARAYRLVP